MNSVQVYFHGTSSGESTLLGHLVYKEGIAFFSFDQNFLKTGLNISPFKLKLSTDLQSAERTPFNGLQGVFSDSLPDGWGMLLMDRRFRALGRSLDTVTPLDRLAYMGNRAMGALSYQPDFCKDDESAGQGIVSLGGLAEESLGLYQGTAVEVLSQLAIIGVSPGGARPKALIGLKDDIAIGGVGDLPEGYEYWIVKFPTGISVEAKGEGAVEYVYSKLARQAGITFPETRLYPSKNTSGYFAVKRFDRGTNHQRFHLHSLAGLVDADFRLPDCDYEILLRVTSHLTKSHADSCQVFRRMIFNILTGNRDDHTKNFSFLMKPDGIWTLSPAYDVTFNFGINGQHSMSVSGYGKEIPLKAIQKIANLIPLNPSKVTEIIEEVSDALSSWDQLSKEYEVPNTMIKDIGRYLNTERLRLSKH
ncbi:type II toxin-antitoxin system HipA family toxin [Deltaproteobacteria bacterium TL4]